MNDDERLEEVFADWGRFVERLKFDATPPGMRTPESVEFYARVQRGEWARRKWNEVAAKCREGQG
jgi:hypothetical protein